MRVQFVLRVARFFISLMLLIMLVISVELRLSGLRPCHLVIKRRTCLISRLISPRDIISIFVPDIKRRVLFFLLFFPSLVLLHLHVFHVYERISRYFSYPDKPIMIPITSRIFGVNWGCRADQSHFGMCFCRLARKSSEGQADAGHHVWRTQNISR